MPNYYDFEVSLQGIQPLIWRRMLLRATGTFADLHAAIQDAFGWETYHLWEFQLPDGTSIAGLPDDEMDPRKPVPDARQLKLNKYFTGKRVVEWCEYVYDFGDDWHHDVKLVALQSHPERFKRRLLAGQLAGPPEDCGGPPGYERLVHYLETGEDLVGDDPDDLGEWIGDWRPDSFDLGRAQAAFDR